jgi:structural maintenance of chromosome 2
MILSMQIGAQVDQLKKTIVDLKDALERAKNKQVTAKEDCRKLEKDMAEFKDNKEGKINELKVLPQSLNRHPMPY